MAQAIGVVGVFIAGHDLIDALSQQHQRVMAYPFAISRVTEGLDPVASSKARSGNRPASLVIWPPEKSQ